METLPLNPMVFNPRFPHLVQKIFNYMDIKSLKNCREVAKLWQNHIDISNLLWIKIVNKLGGTEAFQLACKNSHSKMVQMILHNPSKFDIDVNAQNKTGEAGFELACKNGHSNIAELLIQKSFELKINLNRGRRNFEESGFFIASKNGHSKVAELLIQKSTEFKINLNGNDWYSRESAFYIACKNGHSEVAELLLEKSAEFKIDLRTQGFYGKRASFWAFSNGLSKIAEYFVTKTSELNEKGSQFFHLTCQNGHLELAEMLIQKSVEFKIDLNAKDFGGFTAFENACLSGHTKIVEMLLEKSDEFNIVFKPNNNFKQTAFHLACLKGNTETAEFLIQKSVAFNIDLNAKDKDQKQLLLWPAILVKLK